MKQLLLILLIIFECTLLSAQNSKNYKFNTSEGDSIRNFSVDLPANWYITNETKGTPFAVIGIELTDQQTYDLTKCSPEMRIGISIFQNSLDETLAQLGLIKKSDNTCLYKDTDDYVNIIVLFSLNMENINGVNFSIKKLNTCTTNAEVKRKKKERQTTKCDYILFSYQNTTICFESFNGGFDEATFKLIKTTFLINT